MDNQRPPLMRMRDAYASMRIDARARVSVAKSPDREIRCDPCARARARGISREEDTPRRKDNAARAEC